MVYSDLSTLFFFAIIILLLLSPSHTPTLPMAALIDAPTVATAFVIYHV